MNIKINMWIWEYEKEGYKYVEEGGKWKYKCMRDEWIYEGREGEICEWMNEWMNEWGRTWVKMSGRGQEKEWMRVNEGEWGWI